MHDYVMIFEKNYYEINFKFTNLYVDERNTMRVYFNKINHCLEIFVFFVPNYLQNCNFLIRK